MNFGTHHVCIKVLDPARSAEFYQTALGFRECSIIHHTPTITSYFLSAPDHGLQLQLLHGVGLAADCAAYGHLGMRTEDIQAGFALHSQMGCVSDKIVEQPHQFGYFIKDPDGYETEIVQLK